MTGFGHDRINTIEPPPPTLSAKGHCRLLSRGVTAWDVLSGRADAVPKDLNREAGVRM
jgi:hypothetical protein